MNIFTHIEIAALVNHMSNIFSSRNLLYLSLFQLFAAAVHDYEHPGFNNGYLVKIKSDLALIYNDFSVLGKKFSQYCLKKEFFDYFSRHDRVRKENKNSIELK